MTHIGHVDPGTLGQKVAAGALRAWDVAELPAPPPWRVGLRRLIGPGLMMAGAAIGGGEWLLGPAVTAQYGGTIMWIASLSILLQAGYNLEVMRYALYCGEPIFVGFFRTMPGPMLWTVVYLILDFAAIWPYLSANAAVPLAAAFLGHLPGESPTKYLPVETIVEQSGLPRAVVEEMQAHPHRFGLLNDVVKATGLPAAIVAQMAAEPGRFGSTERWTPLPRGLENWRPNEPAEDAAARTGLPPSVVQRVQAVPERYGTVEQVIRETGLPEDLVRRMAEHTQRYGGTERWKPYPSAVVDHWIGPEQRLTRLLAYGIFLLAFVPLIFGGTIYNSLEKVMVVKIFLVLGYLTFLGVFFVSRSTWLEVFLGFIGLQPSDSGIRWSPLPQLEPGKTLDWTLLAAFAAIAGQGGLTNVAFSNYAREKGWGMGPLVGAIPSAVGGKGIKLLHTGKVFLVSDESLRRWRGWRAITLRDQLGIWVVGCLLGVGIPSLVSLQFVRGQPVRGDQLAAMTAKSLVDSAGLPIFWFLTLLCGFLVLAPSQVSTIDGLVRRWTDVLWTGSEKLERVRPEKVAYVYYTMLLAYAIWGLFILFFVPDQLDIVKFSTGILYNFALGFSSLHTLYVNCVLLPKELRPGWFMRLALVACAAFFISIAARGLL
jgi:hypothetical protein